MKEEVAALPEPRIHHGGETLPLLFLRCTIPLMLMRWSAPASGRHTAPVCRHNNC